MQQIINVGLVIAVIILFVITTSQNMKINKLKRAVSRKTVIEKPQKIVSSVEIPKNIENDIDILIEQNYKQDKMLEKKFFKNGYRIL